MEGSAQLLHQTTREILLTASWLACTGFAPEGAAMPAVFGALGAVGVGAAILAFRQRRKRGRELEPVLARTAFHTSDTVVLTDPDGTIRWVNPAFERVSGYSLEEVVGQTPRILKSGRQSDAFYRELWATIVRGDTWQGRMVNRRKDGSEYELHQVICPLRDASGRVHSMLAVGRDATSESMLRAQLLQAQKLEAIGRLTGGVAHDFNNVLAVILSYTGFILQEAPEGSQLASDAREVEQAARRAADLSRRLLLLTRQEIVRAEAVDLGALVVDLTRLLRRTLGEEVRIEAQTVQGCWPVMADRTQIEQVVMNLAVNARDAVEQGGTIEVGVENRELDEKSARGLGVEPGRWVALQVRDDGCGMTPEVLARAFDPFFTTKSRDKGTGLGLATVRGIVESAGGKVRIESAPGRGTTVTVLLPAAAAPADEPTASAAAQLQAYRGSAGVLLVEDEENVREPICRMLRQHGFRVHAVGRADQASAMLEAHPEIELLLTDVVLPGASGERLARELRRLRPDLRVLFMSGYSDEAIAAAGVSPGSSQLLRKPFSEGELLARIQGILASAGARKVA